MTSTSTTIKTTRKRSSMLPGGVFVQHTPFGSNRASMGGGGTTIVRRSNVLSQSTAPMMPLGEASKASRETVESVKGLRGKEKKTMNDLNGRLADYLEKVRCLEMTNKALYQQLEQLRKVKGITGDDVRAEFEEELEEARNALKEASQQLSPLQANKLELEDKIDTLEAMIEDLKKDRQDLLNKIDKLNQMLGEIEGENASLKRSIENVMTEKDMWKKDNNTLRDDNARIRGDLETARTRQIDAQNELEALAEELQFEKDISAKEIAELKAYIEQMKDFTPKMENMYKSGMKEVMQELQDHYNNQLEEMRNELERRCEERILSMQQNLRRDNTDSAISKTENKQLKIENKDLKDRLHDLEREIMSIQANARRDNTDGIVKQENKTLKSQMNDSRRTLEGLQMENDRLNALIRQLKEEKDKSDAEHDEEMFKMQSRLQELAAELDRVHSDLNELKDSKMDLELEIQCYRKLLDCEENSIKTALADSVNMQSQGGANLASIIAGGPASQSSQQSSNPVKSPAVPTNTGRQPEKSMSQSTGRIHVSRTSKCAISIAEADQGGRSITLSNTSKTKDCDLSNWTLTRTAPRGKVSTFKFGDFKLPADKKVKILSYNNADDKLDEEQAGFIVLVGTQRDCKMWGSGNGSITLTDANEKQMADSKITYITE